MKNRNFFYQQYEKINWENQEKTKINSFVNKFILQEIISKKNDSHIKIFDIGFGIGFFIKMIYKTLDPKYKEIVIEGCEPSDKNYNYFIKKPLKFRKGVQLKTYNSTFLNTKTYEKFDFITAIYVFPHFVSEELEETAKKINLMLEQNGKFILVVANETYIEEKLKSRRDLLMKKETIRLNNKKYHQIWHYSEIPKVGKVLNCDRETNLYLDLFWQKGFDLILKKDLNYNDSVYTVDHICTIFVFQKK